VLALVAVIAGLAYDLKQRTVFENHLQEASARLGLDLLPRHRKIAGGLEGEYEGHAVRVEAVRERQGKSEKRETFVRVPVPVPADLEIRPPSFGRRLLFGEGLKVGDEDFDDAFSVSGADPVAITAILDADVRRALLSPPPGATRQVRDGEIVDTYSGFLSTSETYDESVAAIVAAAKIFPAASAPPLERLAARVARDRSEGAQVSALRLLATHHPGHPTTAGALAEAAGSPQPALRLAAARLLPNAESLPILRRLLEDHPSSRHWTEALALLVERGGIPTDDALQRALGGSPERRALAATALGFRDGPGDEDRLLTLLAADDDVVDVAAADALARVGTARSVELLLEHTRGFFADRAVKAAARRAVETIQARLVGDAGQLSLVEAEGGQLALTEASAAETRTTSAARAELPTSEDA